MLQDESSVSSRPLEGLDRTLGCSVVGRTGGRLEQSLTQDHDNIHVHQLRNLGTRRCDVERQTQRNGNVCQWDTTLHSVQAGSAKTQRKHAMVYTHLSTRRLLECHGRYRELCIKASAMSDSVDLVPSHRQVARVARNHPVEYIYHLRVSVLLRF